MVQTMGQQMTMVGTISLGAIPPWPCFAGFYGQGLLIALNEDPTCNRTGSLFFPDNILTALKSEDSFNITSVHGMYAKKQSFTVNKVMMKFFFSNICSYFGYQKYS